MGLLASEMLVPDIEVFWSLEDNCYVANIPSVTYCASFGSTPIEAVSNLVEAFEAWRTSEAFGRKSLNRRRQNGGA